MNDWIKSILIAFGVVGLCLLIGVPIMEFTMGNPQGWIVPCHAQGYITQAGDNYVYFYPVTDHDNQLLIGQYPLAKGVSFNSSLAPCRVQYTISWGDITAISPVCNKKSTNGETI